MVEDKIHSGNLPLYGTLSSLSYLHCLKKKKKTNKQTHKDPAMDLNQKNFKN